MKRVTSLDFLRGFAIFFTTIFHFLFTSWDTFGDPESILSGGIGLLILGILIFVLIHWRGFFLIISAAANFYQMMMALKKGKKPLAIFGKQVFSGFIMILVGKLWITVFPYWGFVERWTRDASGTMTLLESWQGGWDMFFMIEAIESIGLMMIITAFFFLLFSLKPLRKNVMVNVAICYLVATFIIVISPAVVDWAAVTDGSTIAFSEHFRQVEGVYFHDSILNLGDFFRDFGAVMKKIVLNWIGGREAPLFPMLSYYFLGAAIGMILASDNPKKWQLRILIIPSILFLAGGAYDLLVLYEYNGHTGIDALFANLSFHVHMRWFALVSAGLQPLVIIPFILGVEFNKRINEDRWLRNSKFFRRFGVFALTVYFLGIADALVRYLFQYLFPWADFISRYGLNALQTVLTMTVIMELWAITLLIWDKWLKGYGSFEFLVSLLKPPKKGQKRNWKDPINLEGSLHEVEMISYVK